MVFSVAFLSTQAYLEQHGKLETGIAQLLQTAMHQRLIQIEHQAKFRTGPCLKRQSRTLGPHLGRQRWQMLYE